MAIDVAIEHGDPVGAAKIVEDVMGWWHGYYARAAIKKLRSSVGLVAKVNGSPAGAAIGFAAEGEGPTVGVVYYIVVLRGYRGKGIGKALLSRLENELARRGAELFIATIEEGNTASKGLFTSLGYTVLSISEAEKRFGWEALEALLHAACSYEEEYIAVKELTGVGSMLKCLRVGAYREVWWRACYEPWLELRRARRRRW